MIETSWVHSFIDLYRIVSRANTVKHLLSPQTDKLIEISVATYLDTVSGLMSYVNLDENDTGKTYDTHLIIHFDNGRTLVF